MERILTRGTVKDSAEARLVPEYSMFFDFLIPIFCISLLGPVARAISLFCDWKQQNYSYRKVR